MPNDPVLPVTELADQWEADIKGYVHPIGPLGSAGYLSAAGACIDSLRKSLAAAPVVPVAALEEALDVIADLVNQFAYRIKDDRQPSGMNVNDGAASTLQHAFAYLGLPEVNDEREWMSHLLGDAVEAKLAALAAAEATHGR